MAKVRVRYDFKEDVISRLTAIETKLNNGLIEKMEDFEKRIRSLERGLYIIIGVIGFLELLIKFVLPLMRIH